MFNFLNKEKIINKVIKLGKSAKSKIPKTLSKIPLNFSVPVGAIAASLTPLNDLSLDPSLITKITSAVKNHSINPQDAINALPGELEKYGAIAVDKFLNNGDTLGKHWSHRESQLNNPNLASDPRNAIWEDGIKNISRGSNDMKTNERISASFDNHKDAFIASIQTEDFWKRTLGNAFEASVYTALITAVDQLLQNRNLLINGDDKKRKEILLKILKTSGVMAAGALPVSVFLGVVLMLIPGATILMTPLGIYGSAGLGLRLIHSLIQNPSKQESDLIETINDYLKTKRYIVKKDYAGLGIIELTPVK